MANKIVRFIVKNNVQNYLEAVTYDEMIYQMRKENLIPDTIFLCKPQKFIYLLNTASVNYIDREYLKTTDYPIMRGGTLQGKPTSILVVGTMWYIISAIATMEGEDLSTHYLNCGQNAWKYVAQQYGLSTEIKGNDLVVEGTDKKLCGTGVADNPPETIFMNSFFTDSFPTDIDLTKAFLTPPEKFSDKEVKSSAERITSFETETGEKLDETELVEHIKNYFKTIGISLQIESDFTQVEKDFAESLETKHLSPDWIKYGNYWTDDYKE